MLLLSKEDIKQVFTMKDAISADKQAFKLYSQRKAEVPLRTQIRAPKQEGTFLFMPAYVEEMDTAALKVVSIFPKNNDKGLPAAPAQVILIDGQSGIVSAILDGTYVTQLRTGAASGVAFDVLARQDAKIGALIGTGGQAACQLEAMVAARDLSEVRIYDRDYERTTAFVQLMTQELAAYDTRIIPAKTSDEAIENADMLVTVTSSTTPVFDGTKVKKGATISCVGSYQPHMQEMDPVVLTRASKIYFDSTEAVLAEAGDILLPLAHGVITEKDFSGEIGEVLLGNVVGRETAEEIIVFKTVGIGTQDLVTAKEIYEQARVQGVGTDWQ